MGNHVRTFEVEVEVKRKGSRHFSSHIGQYVEDKITKMFHLEARTSEQARQRGRKYGRVLHVRKANAERLRGDAGMIMQKLQLVNPYPNAVAMDEMIWIRKDKRERRRNNNQQHENGA